MKKLSLNLMSFLYFSAGVNHFINPAFYLKIMPPFFPFPNFLVGLSGVIEIVLGLLLLRNSTRSLAAWAVILMLIAFLPVHIWMISVGGAHFGVGDWILWLRLPLQFVLMGWAYWHTQNPETDRRLIETRVVIAASADRIWQVITDFAHYPDWNPLIISAQGHAALNRKLRIQVKVPASASDPQPQVVQLENLIVTCDPKRHLAWKGRFLWRGLFEGHHSLHLKAISPDQIEVLNTEQYRGALVPLLRSTLDQMESGFQMMNHALKTRCEVETL